MASFNGPVEQFAVYDNVGGAAEGLKRADVLFLGNSRTQYAFRNRDVLHRFLSARGLGYFVLAFGGEGDRFPEAIIRKFDLHPKWVVINVDPFFGTSTTPEATRAMSYGYQEGLKTQFEAVASLAVQSRLHRMFPYFGLAQWDGHPQWIYYLSKSDGTLWLDVWRGTPQAIRPDRGSAGPPLGYWITKDAEDLKKDLDARGAKLILTWIPPSAGGAARQLASLLQVPLVEPEQTGLATFDGSHLDDESCRRFSASFLAAFDRIAGIEVE